MEKAGFLRYVVDHVKGDDKWSLDACFGAALESGAFRREEVVCTKTLYNYVDLGMLPIKNMYLPEKTKRNTKIKAVRKNTYSEKRGEIFKTITADNGSEFANLTFLEDDNLKVYFTRPYSSFEKARWNVTTGC